MWQSISISFEVFFLGFIISLAMAVVIKLTMSIIRKITNRHVKSDLQADSQSVEA